MSRCSDLIGMPYELGADGSTGSIDCIHMVYVVMEELGIPMPTFDNAWYEQSPFAIARHLRAWGFKTDNLYDGNIFWTASSGPSFGVVWQNGILYISQKRNAVHWSPVQYRPRSLIFQCCHTNGS